MSNTLKHGRKTFKPDDTAVIDDVKSYLASCNHVFILDDGEVQVPDDIRLEVVSSIELEYRFSNISIGNHSRYVVALGGVNAVKSGVPVAPYGFVQSWYTTDGTLFSHDYLEQYPH